MTKLSDSTREWAKRAHLALLSPSSITSSARRPCLWCPGQCFLCWVKHFALIPSSHSHYSAQHNTAKGRVRDVLLRSSSSAQLFLQILYFFPPSLMFPYRCPSRRVCWTQGTAPGLCRHSSPRGCVTASALPLCLATVIYSSASLSPFPMHYEAWTTVVPQLPLSPLLCAVSSFRSFLFTQLFARLVFVKRIFLFCLGFLSSSLLFLILFIFSADLQNN